MTPSTLSIKDYTEAHASKYDTWHKRNSYYYQSLERWFQFIVPAKASVFELGMGDGSLAASLQPERLSGIDISPSMVAKAKERNPNGHWIEGDAIKDLPETDAFDYVIGADFLSYSEDIQTVLEQARKLCHARTRLVFTKVNPFWNIPMRIAARLGLAQPRKYASWLGLRQTARLMELAGLDVIRTGKFCLLPIYIPLLSNFVNRYIARLPLIRRFCAIEYLIARPDPSTQTLPVTPSLSVVIPARNESGNIRAALERMPSFPGALEVIFVEGHSKDDTWKRIQEVAAEKWPFSVVYAQQTGKGKGDAVRKGFDMAKGDILMILDADLTVTPETLPRFYDILAKRITDYVQGTRLVYPMESRAMRPLNWLGNQFFGITLSALLGQTFSDTLCGTKCLWKSDYEQLSRARSYFGNFDPFGDFDLIFGAAKLNLKMQEIPIHYKDRTYGETNINRFRDGWLLIRMCAFAAKKLYFIK